MSDELFPDSEEPVKNVEKQTIDIIKETVSKKAEFDKELQENVESLNNLNLMISDLKAEGLNDVILNNINDIANDRSLSYKDRLKKAETLFIDCLNDSVLGANFSEEIRKEKPKNYEQFSFFNKNFKKMKEEQLKKESESKTAEALKGTKPETEMNPIERLNHYMAQKREEKKYQVRPWLKGV